MHTAHAHSVVRVHEFAAHAPSRRIRRAQELCGELAARLAAAGGERGRSITLKVKRRQAGAPEPAKFLGHGHCDNVSRSVTLGSFVGSADELAEHAALLLHALAVPPQELRGLGITVRGRGRASEACLLHTRLAESMLPGSTDDATRCTLPFPCIHNAAAVSCCQP